MMLGAVVNATIFGNMAMLILDMNKQAEEFQSIIDSSNTAMKIEKMPPDIQSRVVAYLNYIQTTLQTQNELTTFFEDISPSLKNEVINFIFSTAIKLNPMFQNQTTFQQTLIYNIRMEMK